MPITVFGREFFSEAEFAQQLGCSEQSLQRLRAAKRIGYQRLPGRRGAYYTSEHVEACFAALSVSARSARTLDTEPVEESKPAPVGPRAPARSSQVGLSDIQLASQILSRREHSR